MHNNQKGISLPLILVVVVIVTVIAIFSLKNTFTKPEPPKKPVTPSPSTETIKDVPSPVNKFLNNFDIKKYEKAGIKIHTGNNPPNIEGSYYFNSLVLSYEEPWAKEGNIGDGVDNYNYNFYDQKPDGTISSSYTAESVPSEADGIGAFISGNDKCFTIFIDDKGKGYSCNTRESRVISACKTDKGLEQVKDGFIMKEKDGPDCEDLMPIGNLRVISEDDGLANQTQ